MSNPGHWCRGIAEAELDGNPVDPTATHLVDGGAMHEVGVAVGEQAQTKPRDGPAGGTAART